MPETINPTTASREAAINILIEWADIHARSMRMRRKHLMIMATERMVPELAEFLAAYRDADLPLSNITDEQLHAAEGGAGVMLMEAERLSAELGGRARSMLDEE